MTDLERTRAYLNAVGIGFDERWSGALQQHIIEVSQPMPMVGGFEGLYIEFNFDTPGNLLQVGAFRCG